MASIQELTDEQLFAMSGRKPASITTPVAQPIDSQRNISQISDEELFKITGTQPKQPSLLQRGTQTAKDIGVSALTGLAELPLGAQQLATSAVGAVAGEQTPAGRISQVLGFLANPIDFIQDPELRAELGRTDVGELRRAQAGAAQRIEELQKEAAKTSPIAAPVGRFGAQLAQLAGAFPAAATVKTAAGASVLGGGILSALQPETQPLTPVQELERRQQQGVTGGLLGGVLGAGAQKLIQSAPSLAAKLGELLPQIPGVFGRGIARIAKVNPQAAQDFAATENIASLGAISDSGVVKLIEATVERIPFAGDVIERNTNKVIANIEANLDRIGGVKGVGTTEAGEIIQGGVRKFVKRFGDAADKLFNRLDRFVPKEENVATSNINKLFQEISTAQPTAPALQARIQNSEGFKIINDIASDAAILGEQLSYGAIKRYRTLIGKKLETSHLMDGEDQAILSRVYGALTDDMRTAFQTKGDIALKAFEKTNNFYSQGLDRIQNSLQKVIQKEAPEKVLRAALEGSKLGGTRIKRIMRSLDEQEREIVKGTVIKGLGKAKPGAQDNTGDRFSVGSFLTKYNDLAPEAKDALFGGLTNPTRKSMEVIAAQASRLKDINRFKNPSGTAQQLGLGAVLMGLWASTSATVGTLATANGFARLFTNESFIKFLGRSVNREITPGNISRSLTELENIAKNNPSIANDISKYIASIAILNGTKNGIKNGS